MVVVGLAATVPVRAQEAATPTPSPVPATSPAPSPSPSPVPAPVVSPTPPTPAPSPTPSPTPTPEKKKPTKKTKGKKQKDSEEPAQVAATNDIPPLDEERYTPERKKGVAEQLLGRYGKDLTVTGNFSTRFMQNNVDGTRDASQQFTDQYVSNLDYRGSGPLQQTADVTIQGKMFNAISMNARLSNSRFGNQFNQVFGFNYHNRDNTTKIDLGNINTNLPGNELVTFSRSVQGVRVDRDLGKLEIPGIPGQFLQIKTQNIASLTRAVTRRGSFRGQGTAGPYFLNAGSLLEGSEKLRLNDKELTPGKDYRIDYLLGQVFFLEGRILNPEDTVVFTYEAQNFNTTPGLLTGTRWDVIGSNGNQYGITYIRQQATGQRTRNGDVIERFPVFADPRYRYQLTSLIDANVPVRIQWYNRLLVENVDYVLNRDLRYFQLLNTSLPPDSAVNYNGNPSLSVTYRPLRQNSLGGDRTVLGVDSTVRLTKNGSVSFNVGRSEGLNEQQNGEAYTIKTAWQSSGDRNRDAWKFSVGIRNVGETFSTIDSTSGAFLQAERNGNATFQYTPAPAYNFATNISQGRIANRSSSTSTTGNTLQWASNQNLETTGQINVKGMPQITLRHQQTTQNSGNSRNTFESSSLRSDWSASSQVRVSGELSRTASQGRSVFATAYNNSVNSTGSVTGSTVIDQLQDGTGSRNITNSSVTTANMSLTYTPATWLSLTGSNGFSRSSNGYNTGGGNRGSATTARTVGLGFTMSPLEWLLYSRKRNPQPGEESATRDEIPMALTITGNYTESSNGQSTAGFYDPNSTDSNSIIPTTTSGQKTRQTSFSVQFAPNGWITMAFNTNQQLSLVPGYDNTDSTSYDYTITTNPKRWLQLGLIAMEQKLNYVGGQGNSNNSTLTVTAGLGPFGRTKVDSTFTQMNFNSATYVGSNNDSLTRQNTVPNWNGSLGGNGYLQTGNNTSWTMSGDYELGSRYSLIARWSSLNQSAPTVGNNSTTAGYRAGSNFWQGQGSLGVDVRLTEIVGFNVNWNYIQLRDREDSRYSYRARMLTADLSARF